MQHRPRAACSTASPLPQPAAHRPSGSAAVCPEPRISVAAAAKPGVAKSAGPGGPLSSWDGLDRQSELQKLINSIPYRKLFLWVLVVLFVYPLAEFFGVRFGVFGCWGRGGEGAGGMHGGGCLMRTCLLVQWRGHCTALSRTLDPTTDPPLTPPTDCNGHVHSVLHWSQLHCQRFGHAAAAVAVARP